ncbi:MAG: hypothetical protein JWP87_3450 [Labilithrix sp.]|nr:hypothetical protein [Labilithrix sp.]
MVTLIAARIFVRMSTNVRRLSCMAAIGLTFGLASVAVEGCTGDAAVLEDGDASLPASPDSGAPTPPQNVPDTGSQDPIDASDGATDGATDSGTDAPVVQTTTEILGAFAAATDNGSSSLVNTFYQTKKTQWIVLASDLTSASDEVDG